MRWSSIVRNFEPFLAPALAGRIRFHATRYRGAHDGEGRGWITLDGQQIASFESLPYLVRTFGLSTELETLGEAPGPAWDRAIEIAHREGLFYLWDFQTAVAGYPSLSITSALTDPDPITRALAMLDRRLGKRRLAAIDLTSEHEIVRTLHDLRCEAEGLRPRVPATTAD
jgi:hypothetical protein